MAPKRKAAGIVAEMTAATAAIEDIRAALTQAGFSKGRVSQLCPLPKQKTQDHEMTKPTSKRDRDDTRSNTTKTIFAERTTSENPTNENLCGATIEGTHAAKKQAGFSLWKACICGGKGVPS